VVICPQAQTIAYAAPTCPAAAHLILHNGALHSDITEASPTILAHRRLPALIAARGPQNFPDPAAGRCRLHTSS